MYLFGHPFSLPPISHCHLHCYIHRVSSSFCPCSDILHWVTPHYRHLSQPLPGSNTPYGLAVSVMGFSLYPAILCWVIASTFIQYMCLLLLSLLSVSDMHTSPPYFTRDALLTQAGLWQPTLDYCRPLTCWHRCSIAWLQLMDF